MNITMKYLTGNEDQTQVDCKDMVNMTLKSLATLNKHRLWESQETKTPFTPLTTKLEDFSDHYKNMVRVNTPKIEKNGIVDFARCAKSEGSLRGQKQQSHRRGLLPPFYHSHRTLQNSIVIH